jgi:hypothetical protein
MQHPVSGGGFICCCPVAWQLGIQQPEYSIRKPTLLSHSENEARNLEKEIAKENGMESNLIIRDAMDYHRRRTKELHFSFRRVDVAHHLIELLL